MSEVETKPVEETPVTTAPEETTTAPESKVEETPAAEPASETAPAAEATESTPVAAEETPAPATEETVKEGEAKVEATPASEGVLGFKHPPFPNTLRFAKRFFWFSEEPVKAENLSSYLRETKADVAHPTAAWAQETGKGLFFYAKRAEDKSAPTGIIHLADVTDVTKEGSKDFSFKVNGHKNIFQTESTEQQASWIVALETKVAEAKELKESITGSEGYKSSLEKYAKPASLFAPGAAATAAAAGTKSTSPAPKKSLDTKEVISSDEDKKAKSRSVSRKRNSIFGSLLSKKDELLEKKEAKKEEKAEEKTEAKEGEPSTATEVATDAAVAAPVAAAAEEKKEEKTEEATPAPTEAPEASTSERPVLDAKKKRSSVFGNFFNKVTSPSAEKSEKEVVPEVPAKDTETTEPVAETAPQVDAPVETEPIDTAAVTAPVDEATETPAAETKPETKEAAPVKESKGLKSFFKKVEGKKEAKEEEKAEKKAEETPAATSTEAPAAEATPAATETAPTETAPKEKRRTSLFGTLSGTIKKKTGGKKTPTEEKKETTESTPEATEEATEAKPEPISKDETTEPATNGVTAEEPTKEVEPIVDSTADQGLESTPAVKAAA